MTTTYEVQGRRTERDPDGKVRDVVRLESTPARDSAFDIAGAMTAENLTVWVFAVERRAGKARYRLLGTWPQSPGPDSGRAETRDPSTIRHDIRTR